MIYRSFYLAKCARLPVNLESHCQVKSIVAGDNCIAVTVGLEIMDFKVFAFFILEFQLCGLYLPVPVFWYMMPH